MFENSQASFLRRVAWLIGATALVPFCLLSQQTASNTPVVVNCKVNQQPDRQVTLERFQDLHCQRTLEYFQALDHLRPKPYGQIRDSLKWTVTKLIDYQANVTSGTESFTVMPGIQVVRVYSAAAMTVNARNDRDTPIFIEGYDIHEGEPFDIRKVAFIAMTAHSQRMMSTVQAFVANPLWDSGKMQISVLTQ
jgi:hypothetical protein